MKGYLFSILLFSITLTTAQTKNEFEKRIPLDSFPIPAQESLKILPTNIQKKRFFQELSGNKVSYEIKFRYEKKHYSIEFSQSGKLEDIEINVKEKTIQPEVQSIMEDHFKSQYKKFRWLKIQEQYNYDGKQSETGFILEVMNGGADSLPYYEIVAEVKKNRSYILKEYNFNHKGDIIQVKIIDPESYEHVLY